MIESFLVVSVDMVEAESLVVVESVLMVAVESVTVVVVSVVSVLVLEQAVAKAIIARRKNADFAIIIKI
ncbi:hypothetical protein GCM10028807_15820 [Spirosoma daeguense]